MQCYAHCLVIEYGFVQPTGQARMHVCVGLARTIYKRSIYDIVGKGITKYTVMYGVHICRVGQNRIYTPYMTVYLVISLPKIPYVPYIYGSGQPYVYDFLLACWAHNLLVKL